MKATSKISLIFVLLFSATLTFGQCESYRQKAEAYFAQKNYDDAKRQYMNYKECKPNAAGIDEKIDECDRLQKDAANNNSGVNYNSGSGTNITTTQTTAQTPPPNHTKTTIGVGAFSGYKSDQVKNNVTSAFVGDGRFIVTQVQNSGYGNNQQNSSDVDYIISGTSECIQSERTQYLNLPATKYSSAMNTPYTTPEVVNVAITFTNAKTGEIVANTTYNLNKINRISSDIFPVKFTINNVDGGTIGIVNITGGTYFVGDVFNVYEENSNGGNSFLGKLKIGKTNNDCKITDRKKEINNRFKAGAKLIATK